MIALRGTTANRLDGSEERDRDACSRGTCNDDASRTKPSPAVYFLNAPDNESSVIAMTGHAALLLVSATYGFELYNFSPFDNKSAFAQGAIAQTVDRIDSFDAFVERCAANSFEGIEIQNGYTQWHEPYKRAIKLGVTGDQLTKIRDYAQAIKAKPPRFSFFGGYSCSNFCWLRLNVPIYTS